MSLTLMDADREYFLLLMDIRDSTEMSPEQSERAMGRLREELLRVNRRLQRDLALRLRMSYGDEIAGLFKSPPRLFDAVAAVRDVLYPDAAMRFVVTRGKIGVPTRDMRRVSGPAFKEADGVMGTLKSQNRFAAWRLGDALLDDVLDSLTRTSNALLEEMTDNQRKVFDLVRFGMKRVEIAEKLGKSKQAVSDAAVRGRVDLVVDAERAIRRVLEELGQGNPLIPHSSR